MGNRVSDLHPWFTPVGHPGNKAYISGPMSGIPDENYPAFNYAAAVLRRYDYRVCNPAETSAHLGELEHHEFLRFDLHRVLEADVVFVLPGWEESVGAKIEVAVACRVGTPVIKFEGLDRRPVQPQPIDGARLEVTYE